MKFRAIATLVLALCLGVSSVQAHSIGVFFDPAGATCHASIAAFTPATWYILAVTGPGLLGGGITGAEFRMDGTPAGWFMTPNANPAANLTIGNPLTGGCNIGFPACQPGPGVILLYTVSGFATSLVPETALRIQQHTTPSNPLFQCPLFSQCDAPTYSLICVGRGEAFINGRPCTVGVAPTSWTAVKGLYN